MGTLLAVLAAVGPGGTSAPKGDWVASANLWVERQISAGAGAPSEFAFLFLGGLLASLLPCVYPLYPITAGIVRGRGAGRAGWLHPVTYYFGLAAAYFGFGVIAGVSGGAFNEVLRWPAVNVALALLFFVLALATAGVLHLDWFGGVAPGRDAPGLHGTFLMGIGAGLLSSSCVGPFVIGILVALAGQAGESIRLGAVFAAAFKMLAFGLGLGLPFLAVGLFGVKLPKSGGWMRWVQWALAALIAWFAYSYLEKGLGTLGVAPGGITLVFWSALAFVAAVFFVQGASAPVPERMARAVWALAAVAATLAMARGVSPLAAAPPVAAAGPQTIESGGLDWFIDRKDAVEEARRTGRPIFVDFFAHWCANCKEFDKRVATDQALQAALRGAVRLKIQDSDPEFKEFQADSRFPELKTGLPFFAIVNAEDQLLYKTSDFTRTSEMILFLEE